MATETRTTLEALISEAEINLASLRKALKGYDEGQLEARSLAMRKEQAAKTFEGEPPIDVAIMILGNHDGRMNRSLLEAELEASGVNAGKGRAGNIRQSIDTNIRIQNLVQDGEDILIGPRRLLVQAKHRGPSVGHPLSS